MASVGSLCCGCAGLNCEVRQLIAVKRRAGFPVLYIRSNGDAGNKSSSLRYMNKSQTYNYTVNGVLTENWACDFACVDRYTGELTLNETSTTGTPSDVRANALAAINAIWVSYKDSASGTYGSFDPDTGYGTQVVVDFTIDGHDMIAASATMTNVSEGLGTRVTETSVTLSTENTDANLTDDIDDLLLNYDTGSGNGLDGMADNTLAIITWNENGYFAGPSEGVYYHNPADLTGYVGIAAAAIVLTTYSPDDWFTFAGQWWQHAGGGDSNGEGIGDPNFSIFDCTFTADGSMPFLDQAATDWSQEWSSAFQFNVPPSVCGQWELYYWNGSTYVSAGSACGLSSGSPAKLFQPHPVAYSRSRIDFARAQAFTAPGALTAGDCPCTTA